MFVVFGGTFDFGVFLAVPLPFIFYGKREGEPSDDTSEDPHPHRHLETGLPKGLLRVGG